MFKNSLSICYTFFDVNDVIVTSVDTHTSLSGIMVCSRHGAIIIAPWFQNARKSEFPSSFFQVPSSERFSELGSRNSDIYWNSSKQI